jgi:hypothetical protein
MIYNYERRNSALWGTGQRQRRQVQVRCVTLQKQTDLLLHENEEN